MRNTVPTHLRPCYRVRHATWLKGGVSGSPSAAGNWKIDEPADMKSNAINDYEIFKVAAGGSHYKATIHFGKLPLLYTYALKAWAVELSVAVKLEVACAGFYHWDFSGLSEAILRQ